MNRNLWCTTLKQGFWVSPSHFQHSVKLWNHGADLRPLKPRGPQEVQQHLYTAAECQTSHIKCWRWVVESSPGLGVPGLGSIPSPADQLCDLRQAIHSPSLRLHTYQIEHWTRWFPRSLKLKEGRGILAIKKNPYRGTWVAQWWSICLWLRAWSQGPGIESYIRFPTGSLPLLCLCLCLSLCVSWINK